MLSGPQSSQALRTHINTRRAQRERSHESTTVCNATRSKIWRPQFLCCARKLWYISLPVLQTYEDLFSKHTNTSPGTSSSPGCPAPVMNSIRRSPGMQCFELQHTFETVDTENIYAELLRQLYRKYSA